MNKFFTVIIIPLLFVFFTNYICKAEETPLYIFLQPVCDKEGQVFQVKDNQEYPLLEEIPSGREDVKPVKELLASGMPEISLKLDKFTKNFMINQINAGSVNERGIEIFYEPLYICIIKGGNRPKCGFFLKKENEILDKRAVYYIEMPPDPATFEKIFSHEHGHLLDAYIMNYEFPYSPERQVHTISAVTDYEVAFLEGWGEHFETVTIDLTENKELKDYYNLNDLKGKMYFFYLQDMMTIAQSFKRYSWVKGNLFAFKRNNYLVDGLAGEEFEKNFFYNWMNCNFLMGELKNGQQMLSCEGVLSHIFYQMITDENLRNSFEEEGFYENFFLTGESTEISPLENIYLKIIYAKYHQFKVYEKDKPLVAGPLLLDFIAKYIELFPKDKGEAIQIFSLSTFFTTSLKDAQKMYHRADFNSHLIAFDMEGVSQSFMDLFKTVQTVFGEITDKSPSSLYENMGTVLWIENDSFKVTSFGQIQQNLSINLNAAEEFEFMTLPGVTAEQARALVSYRENQGYFSDIQEIQKANILREEQFKEILRMRELFLDRCDNLEI